MAEVDTTDDVQILRRTPDVIAASVRDGSGVWDVRWASSAGGWSCTCNEAGGRCAHVLAVEQLTRDRTDPIVPTHEGAIR